MNRRSIPFAFAIAFVALLALVGVMLTQSQPVAVAAPAAIPTPVSASAASAAPKVVTFLSGEVVVTGTATGSSVQNIANYQRADLQWVVDQTDVNTVTVKLQFSNDGVNWVDGATFLSSNAADANDMQQYAIFGQYARVNYDATNTNPVTITVVGVAK